MQAFGVWPLKSDSWKGFELGFCSNSISRSGVVERFDLAGSSGFRTTCLSPQISGSRWKSWSEHSFPRFHLFCNPRKNGSFGSFSALALVSKEQTSVCGTLEKDSLPLNQVSEKIQNEDFGGCLQLEGIRNVGSSREEGDGSNSVRGEDNQEDIRGKRHGRIDVKALAKSLHSAKNADDVEEILRDKGELPLQVCSSMIRGFGKDNKLDSAMALVDWLRRRSKDSSGSIHPNLFIYNSLLGAAKEAEKYDVVEKVMEDMVLDGINPNVVTYNILMSAYIQQGQELEALNLFEEISRNGLSPSPASYSTALFAYRRLEDGVGAVKFFVEIRDKYGKDGDENWEAEFSKLENFTIRICYQVMRQWLTKPENLSINVLRLLTEMDKSGLVPGRAEYERLVWACTREEHYVVAKELYERIRERSSEISLSVCNHVIWLMGKAKKWWAALEIYEDLLENGPKPNNMSYELIVSHFNVLLGAARKRGIWRWGVRLLEKMEEKGLKPGSREWNAVLIACSKASETSAAIEIFKRMVERGEKPTIISYGALLSALEKGKLYNEALQVWKHMLKLGVEPNLYAYTIMASLYTSQGKFDAVNSTLLEMKTRGIEPTVVTFNAIISGCARNEMGSAAYEWFQHMKALNIAPNEVTYETMIVALAEDGKPRLSYELYTRAQNEDMVLSAKAYDAVIRSAQLHRATIDVSTLGPRPPEKPKKKVQTRNSLPQLCIGGSL
ncbi:PREDICTED: pentatricopeptide repeat-containing protein At3g46610-like isoform X2 [Ipomoea nil]|uniref:pentatricopeptide repeat-containing protein At3g46610-like isoform X2 n=1 Tax=Ipomoea nil TaxID=35883 RepID=UPI000900DC6B|nr:PREDICTED: pentatricopeptide repeat-containing protein At3g46610-like isoform X2 [Ipomoea nil]